MQGFSAVVEMTYMISGDIGMTTYVIGRNSNEK